MSDIFLSYATEDRERVRPLSSALEALGWKVFWDVQTPPAETWRHFIETQLQQARCFVVVWSKVSVASEWVLEEADEAKSQRKQRLSVVIDDLDKLPFGHRGPQAASLVGWDGDTADPRFQTLVSVLEAWLGTAPARGGKASAPAEESHRPEAAVPRAEAGAEVGEGAAPAGAIPQPSDGLERTGMLPFVIYRVVLGLVIAGGIFLQVLEEQRPKEDRIDEVLAKAETMFEQAGSRGFEPSDLVGLPGQLARERQAIDRLAPDRFQSEAVDERFFRWFMELARVAAERRERSLATVALEYADGIRPGDPEITGLREAIEQSSASGSVVEIQAGADDPEIPEILARARQAFDEQRLTRPAEGSALALYREVLRRDPDNPEAKRGIEAIIDWYLTRVAAALDGRELDAAADFLARAEQVQADHPGVRAAAARLEELNSRAAEPVDRNDERRAGDVLRDAPRNGRDGPEMIVIPAGEFRMGDLAGGGHSDEQPVHPVRVGRFALGRDEITFDEYDAFARATGREMPSDAGWGRGRRPVINVSWEDANAYAEWLSGQTGKRYRLPSEAEWEYAARAGSETAYWWGPEVGRGRANCDGCGSQWDNRQTAPVRSFEPNEFGVFDTAGNVWEWTQDCWHGDYVGAPTDGSPWLEVKGGDCTLRVVRGGSWYNEPRRVRSASRNGGPVGGRGFELGFRLAQDLD